MSTFSNAGSALSSYTIIKIRSNRMFYHNEVEMGVIQLSSSYSKATKTISLLVCQTILNNHNHFFLFAALISRNTTT